MIAASGATPATPASSRLAARMPAMCVPWPLRVVGRRVAVDEVPARDERGRRGRDGRGRRRCRPARSSPRRRGVTAHAAGGVEVRVGHGGRAEHGRAGVLEPPLEGEQRVGGEPRAAGRPPPRPRRDRRAARRGPRRARPPAGARARRRAAAASGRGARRRRPAASARSSADSPSPRTTMSPSPATAGAAPQSATATPSRRRGAGSGRHRDAAHQSSTQRLRPPSSCHSTGKNASSSSCSPGRR